MLLCLFFFVLLTRGMYFSLYYFSFFVFHQLEGEKKERRKILFGQLVFTAHTLNLIYFVSFWSSVRLRGERRRSWSNYNKEKSEAAVPIFLFWETTMLRWNLKEKKREFLLKYLFSKKKSCIIAPKIVEFLYAMISWTFWH